MSEIAFAQSLPDDVILPEDWGFLRQLVVCAVEGSSVPQLLDALAQHLQLIALIWVRPEERPPQIRRAVVAALQRGGVRLGDLYAALPDHADSIDMAARLMFFAPVMALCITADEISVSHKGSFG